MRSCRTRSRAGAWGALALLLFAGCQESGETTARSAPGEPVAGGTAVAALSADPDILNPLLYTSASSGTVLALIKVGTARMGQDLRWDPTLAASWEIAPDGLEITYHLRPWVWEDGHPLTARDLALSMRLYLDPAVSSPLARLYEAVAGVAVLDSATIRYRLEHPVPDPLSVTVHPILPAHRVEQLDPGTVRQWDEGVRPLASGPFRLRSWEHHQEIVLERNPRYPGSDVPLLDRLVLRIIPEEASRVLALEAGEVDVVEDVSSHAVARLEGRDDLVIHHVVGRAFGYLVFNCRDGRLADRRVRKAVSLAIDRGRFVDGLLHGCGRPAASILPPVLWAHDADLAPDPLDPGRARRLLEEAGWVDADGDGIREREGVPLAIEVLTRQGDPVRENGVVVLRENLRRIGIDVRPRVLELATALALVREGDFQAYLGVRTANLNVDPSFLIHSTATDQANYGHYRNAAVDSLLETALALADREAARPVWYRLQEELLRDPPMALIYYPETIVAVSRRIRDARPHMLGTFSNAAEWWIAPQDRKYAPASGNSGG